MKVAQLVGVWVVALALAVVAATLVWTTWLEPEPVTAPGPEPLSDAERVWCSNNPVRVMLSAAPLGIRVPDTLGDVEGLRALLANLGLTEIEGSAPWTSAFGDFNEWAGRNTSVEDDPAFYERVWTTTPFDRLCRAAFEGR